MPTYPKATAIQAPWCWRPGSDKEANGTEQRAREQAHTRQWLTSDQGAKATRWSKDGLFPTRWDKKNVDTDLTTVTEMNLKWITDVSVKGKTMDLQEDNTGGNLRGLGYGSAP